MTVDTDKPGPEGAPQTSGPVAIKAIPVRHYGRYLSAVIAIAAQRHRLNRST